jgi:hypothetical protein
VNRAIHLDDDDELSDSGSDDDDNDDKDSPPAKKQKKTSVMGTHTHTKHNPKLPEGKLRIYFRGKCKDHDFPHLIKRGVKFMTCRAWKDKTNTSLKRTIGKEMVRAQTNWAADTLFGYLSINKMDGPLAIGNVLTPDIIAACGCKGWSKEKYIKRWAKGNNMLMVHVITFTYFPS